MKCSVEGCAEKRKAKGLCMKHYFRLRRYGRLHTIRDGDWRPYRHGVVRICSLPGCTDQHYGRDLCYRHWKQSWRMRQKATTPSKRLPIAPLRAHLEEYVERHGFNVAAETLSVSQSHLTELLHKCKAINLNTADRICLELGLPFDALFNQEVA